MARYSNIPDVLTHDGAHRLRRMIEAHWAAKGQFPTVRVMPVWPESSVYQVRSDMINGCPQNG